MHEDLLARREDYPILARKTYLINNSLGAMHRGTRARLQRYADLWDTEGVLAWHEWFPEVIRVADLAGAAIGAPPGTTVHRQAVADVMVAAASAVDFSGSRNRVVYSEADWPGSHYFWREQARHGVNPVVVPLGSDGFVDEQCLVDAIDERTALVSISLVAFRTSQLLDVAPIVARAHAVGALVLLDAYQAAGTVPFDVVELGVDFCVGGSVKFLCGGPGNGWMYVRPDLAPMLRPAAIGWISAEKPFEFTWDDITYAPGVLRFAGGTPNVPAAYAAAPGYQAILDIGVERIRERSQSLTQPLIDGALERGFRVRSPYDAQRRGGHVTVDPGDGARVHDELLARGFVVDYRPGAGIRIAPHFYNTSDECAAVLDEMTRIRREAA